MRMTLTPCLLAGIVMLLIAFSSGCCWHAVKPLPAGVSATDTCDGARTVNVECRDASNNVVAFPVPDTYPTGGVNPYVFTLTYTSTDTSANVRTQVANLTLTDDNPPVITITGANPA
ncbi:MAG TPA: hypothetical protein PL176_12180, partial [Kiritimatiellia bacterium]|nr:hypothetical protein [Kiritimatiellia bacterium]